MPSYITVINLAFALPNLKYWKGKNNLEGTGLDFPVDFWAVKRAVEKLKSKNPKVRVQLSVGGASYYDWRNTDIQAAVHLVNDLGLDGIDIDYEPRNNHCSWETTTKGSCPSDKEFTNLIKNYRDTLPRNKKLTAAGWSTGPYGWEKYPAGRSPPIGGDSYGAFINPLRQVGSLLDSIYIMSYDADLVYNITQGYDAYRQLYKGELCIGIEIPPESWGKHVISMNEVDHLLSYMDDHGGNGVMLWALQEQPKVKAPNPTEIFQRACRHYKMQNCDQIVPH
ncbi:hypothetical protein AKO1_008255 [Acrasis kona]|uniref:GH18 domain-containing protein n=1 Tax=Acrasis kona TaxID=1008807 RepID=A0AAW2YPS7_9EUKA